MSRLAQSSLAAPAVFRVPARHPVYPWIALLAGVIAMARCVSTVGVFNHTTDELAHIAGAVGFYESGRNLYMVEHPTLQRIVVGAALRIAGVSYPPAREVGPIPPRTQANPVGAAIVFEGKVGYWKTLAIARCANLFFLAALLLHVYLIGRYLISPLGGMIACVFLSLDANILAHSAMVTTDIPAAAGFVAATYYALRYIARPTWPRTLVAGFTFGLALSCKFTCVLLAPMILVLIGLRAWGKRKIGTEARRHGGAKGEGPTGSAWRRAGQMAAIAAVAFVTLWATYLFNVGRLRDQEVFTDQKTWVKLPQAIKDIPIPMPSMALGLMFMAALGKTGFPCYFNGQLDFGNHPAYFPEAAVLKTPIGFLAALFIAIIVFALTRRRAVRSLCILLPPSLLLLTAMTGKLQIGIRHILPVIPMLYLFAALHLARGRLAMLALPLMLLAAIETAGIHPDYLAYFNRPAGGPAGGHRYLADSNLDWGQDVARLADYLKSTGRSDYTIHVSGAEVEKLLIHLKLDPTSRPQHARAGMLERLDKLQSHPHGLLAIGKNVRLGLEDFRRSEDGDITRGHDYSWLKGYPVVARIGWSIEVYDLDARR